MKKDQVSKTAFRLALFVTMLHESEEWRNRLPEGAGQEATGGEAAHTGLHFDVPARRAWYAGQPLELRPREYDLLHCLAQHRGQVMSRDVLLDQVWGTSEFYDDRTVDVHVHRLRQKLAEVKPDADPIQTERGIGYRLEL